MDDWDDPEKLAGAVAALSLEAREAFKEAFDERVCWHCLWPRTPPGSTCYCLADD